MLLGLGAKINGSPYTYPEVEGIQNVAELMDNILTRSRLTTQAALKAKMEHLALMSRGMAHDLKNLITPVSSFLVHTDGQYAPETIEHEVHTAAKHSMQVITDYVGEALFFANRLEPNLEPSSLRSIFDRVVEVSQERAARRQVAVRVDLGSDQQLTVDAVLLQRALVNLVHNAVDASREEQTVTLRAPRRTPGRVHIEVVDQGCGISPEDVGRVFDPYFTTKDLGTEIRGFGLGLTICQKIVQLHGGSIAIESQKDCGTTVAVDLPTLPRLPDDAPDQRQRLPPLR